MIFDKKNAAENPPQDRKRKMPMKRSFSGKITAKGASITGTTT